MWNNGHNCEFISPMGEEILLKSITIAKLKVDGITEDSALYYTMVKMNSAFDKLEEGIFGTPITTSPHVGHTSESDPAFSQPQYERPFYYYLDQHGRFVSDNQSKLASLASETYRANSREVSAKLLAKKPCYFDQHDQSKLVSSALETDGTN